MEGSASLLGDLFFFDLVAFDFFLPDQQQENVRNCHAKKWGCVNGMQFILVACLLYQLSLTWSNTERIINPAKESLKNQL